MKNLNWAQLIFGTWIMASPWILGFSEITTALWNNAIFGILIVISALWQLFGSKPQSSSTPQQ